MENYLMPESEGSLLCYAVVGAVTETSYVVFLNNVKDRIAAYGEFRLLLDYQNFLGWEKEAAEMDVSFYIEQGRFMKRFCLVGPPDKEILSKSIASAMISGELKVFSREHFADALAWAKEGMPPPLNKA